VRNIIPLLTIFSLVLVPSYSQDDIHLYGFLKDSLSGEVLPGATIVCGQHGTVSDYNGYFNIKINTPDSIIISYVGYDKKLIFITKNRDTLINLHLKASNNIDEITVTHEKPKSNNISTLSGKELVQIPSLGAKPDVAKALHLLPGISAKSEGTSIIQVRGGDPGQNLYLFDNVPIIYVNHLGGFMSVFNTDIINNIDIYKGPFPARYGGKLSSVIDITQKEGNLSKLTGNIGLGLTDLSFAIEGPSKINNSGFIITGRKTLTDPLMYLISNIAEGNDFSVAYGFHDINSKFTWKPDIKNTCNLNVYYGDDYLFYWQNSRNEKHNFSNYWGNMMFSGHWKSVRNPKLYSKTTVSYTRYRLKNKHDYNLKNIEIQDDYLQQNLSSVSDFSIVTSFKHSFLNNVLNEYGLRSSILNYLPFYSVNSRNLNGRQNRVLSNETSVYASTKITINNYSNLAGGIRFSSFHKESYMDYSIEPRFNINLGLNNIHSIHGGYMNTKQYTHLLLTSGSIMLKELWIPADSSTPASTVEQFTGGYTAGYDGFQVNAGFFYKNMYNLATYKEGYSTFEGDDDWKSKIETKGIGKSKGLELQLTKTKGKITGFIAYTISKTTREFPNINFGKEYLFDYDRTHSLSIYAHYRISKKIDINLSWIYQTGIPYTPAIGKIYSPSTEADNVVYTERLLYAERNSSRMKDYHRLDFGLNYNITTKGNRSAIWSFSVYNLYNRQNPYFYYYNTNNTGEILVPEPGNEILPLKLYQVSFFPIIPTVSYKLFFEKVNKNKTKKIEKFRKWLYHDDV